jgi:hypothetical protein
MRVIASDRLVRDWRVHYFRIALLHRAAINLQIAMCKDSRHWTTGLLSLLSAPINVHLSAADTATVIALLSDTRLPLTAPPTTVDTNDPSTTAPIANIPNAPSSSAMQPNQPTPKDQARVAEALAILQSSSQKLLQQHRTSTTTSTTTTSPPPPSSPSCSSSILISLAVAMVEHGLIATRWSDSEGCSVLHHAACLPNSSELVQCLLSHHADPRSRDYIRWTPLHYCISGACDQQVIKLLLDSGARIDARDFNQASGIDLANELGKHDIAQWMQQYDGNRKHYCSSTTDDDEDDDEDDMMMVANVLGDDDDQASSDGDDEDRIDIAYQYTDR